MPSSRRLGRLEITLIVVDVILIGVLIFLLATQPDGPDDPGDETSSSADAATDADASETDSPSSTQAVTVPEGALDLAEFTTPSGNIWCTISDDEATCQIETIEFQPPSIDGCDDNELAGHVLRVSGDVAEYPCPDGPIAGAAAEDRTVLEYGQTTHVGDYMCTSTEEGVSCTDINTGASFSVRRAGATVAPA
jgi:hypothetical protein